MTEFFAGSGRLLKVGVLLPIIALNGWVFMQIFHYFEPLITIFIVATVLAFILNYPVDFLQKRNIDHSYAVLVVLLASLVALVGFGVTLLPALLEQISSIVVQLPDLLNVASDKLQVVQNWASAHRLPINLKQLIRQSTEGVPAQLPELGDETVLLTLNAVGGLSSLLLTLVLTLYLLLDGKRVWNAIFRWLPPHYSARVQRSLQSNFRNYFIGQATLGLIMGVLFSLVFFVLKVPYSLLFGSTIGIMTLIPFGDALGYGLVCLLLLTQSPGLAVTTFAVAIVIDQVIDQAIAPRILGGFTGLKPIWVIIALLLGTKLFGFPGLLVAVPVASSISTLIEDEQSERNALPIAEAEIAGPLLADAKVD